MNSATNTIDLTTIDSSKLRGYLYRANYAVLKCSNISKLSNDIKDEYSDLCVAYADKFPIASEHLYECRLNDEDGQIVEADVIPASLLYSMTNEWQERFCLVLDALTDLESDDDRYYVVLLDPKKNRACDDPFNDRWQIWETDTIVDDSWYPYGKD